MAFYMWSGSMKYAQYGGETEADDRRIAWFDDLTGDPLPPLDKWVPPRLVQYLGDGKKKRKPAPIGDAPTAGHPHLISLLAYEALRDIWDRHADLYPVLLSDRPEESFFMVVPKIELSCLDRENSSGKIRKYGKLAGYFGPVERWVFDERCVGDADLFVIPDSRTAIYVSERFKQRVIDSGLKGFCLKREFWEEKPFVS